MTAHYFTDDQPATEQDLRRVRIAERGLNLSMVTADRVFSAKGLDAATRVLLQVVPSPPPDGKLLDLGCGWGPMAAVMATESPNAEVWAVDVSMRALDLVRRNSISLGLSNIRALTETDALRATGDQDVEFKAIWSNPPIRIGKSALRELLMRWLPRLAPDGEAYLVIGKNLGADSMAVWLFEQGFVVRRVVSRRGFRVLSVTKQT